MAPPAVKVSRLRATAGLPGYMTSGAAGMDLSAAIDEPIVLAAGERRAIPIGIAIAIPDGYEGQVRPRSGLALHSGVTVANAPGTIDADYRGELQVILVNLGAEPHTIRPGDRVAQLVFAPVTRVAIEEVASLPPTERGSGGFGSTG